MSQTAITLAFEQWKASQAVTGESVLLDEFVFANVPGLDATKPVDRSETLPPAAQIVHRQAVSRKGVVNENAVVHSVVLGAEVGDFSFNWIGLINKASNTLAMIVHAPLQQKLKTKDGQQGNVLTRSFLMEYNGAQAETGINTPAETWQIDFTARMAGMDERQRLENIDLYGAAAFLGNGYLVAKSGTQYYVTAGAGYVRGLRAHLAANQNITVTTKPVKVWLDVAWTGTLTSTWGVTSKITVAADLADYVQNGMQHYVFAVASIDANGNITDLRPKGTLNEQIASDALKKHEQSRNHPDATLTAKGFTQLSSVTDSTSESVAATPKAVKAAYDLAKGKYTAQDATTAQKGIVQLSSAPDSTSESVAATPKAVKAAYDLAKGKYTAQDATTAQKGIVQLSSAIDSTSETLAATPKAVKAANDNANGRVPAGRKINGHALTSDTNVTSQDIFNGQAFGLSTEDLDTLKTPGIYYQPANANASVARHYPETNAGTLLVYKNAGVTQVYLVYNSSRTYTRSQYSTGAWTAWAKQYDTANKPSPADINAVNKGGDTMTGLLNMNAGASVSGTLTFKNGSGIVSEKTGANPRNGRIYWGGDASRGNRVEFADDSGWKAYIERHPASGVQLVVNGRINGSIIYSSGEVQAGGGKTRLATDGNIFGAKWGNQWLDVYLKNTFQPKGSYTPAGQAYTKAESNARYLQDLRLGARNYQLMARGKMYEISGNVITGLQIEGQVDGDGDYIVIRPLQKQINGTWYTVAQS
ncbi:tail fiber protein [Enterobacter cloacae]|uniref:tail fiber protein n=1 Tax=Enterobacter cloacae TaxID=550 RepID=UPI002FF71843